MALFTLADLDRRVRLRINEQLESPVVRQILDTQYRTLLTNHKWSFVKTEAALLTVAEKSDGTIAATQGSDTVTGAGTSFDDGDVGSLLFLPDDLAYKVTAVNAGAQTLTLLDGYAGADVTGGAYALRKNLYTLDTDVEDILSFVAPNWTLDEQTQMWIRDIDPHYKVTGEPTVWAMAGVTSSGQYQIELWPVPTERFYLPYIGLVRGSLSSGSQTVADIGVLLLDLACAEACRVLFGRTADPRWQALENSYEVKAQDDLFRLKRRDRARQGRDEVRSGHRFERLADDPRYDFGPEW